MYQQSIFKMFNVIFYKISSILLLPIPLLNKFLFFFKKNTNIAIYQNIWNIFKN